MLNCLGWHNRATATTNIQIERYFNYSVVNEGELTKAKLVYFTVRATCALKKARTIFHIILFKNELCWFVQKILNFRVEVHYPNPSEREILR